MNKEINDNKKTILGAGIEQFCSLFKRRDFALAGRIDPDCDFLKDVKKEELDTSNLGIFLDLGYTLSAASVEMTDSLAKQIEDEKTRRTEINNTLEYKV